MSGRIKVLYVDDEFGLLELGKLFLEQAGQFTVEIQTSAHDGLVRLEDQDFDAIISDYQMPGIDGIEFLRMVRSSGNAIPFILFTGRGREEVVIEAINNGADFYLQKGGEPKAQFAELAHKIRQAVKQRKAEDALRASEERYRSVVNDQSEMIVRFDSAGIISFVNEAFRSFYLPLPGSDNLIGKNIIDCIGSGTPEKVEFSLVEGLTPEAPLREIEQKVNGADGKMYWQRWVIRALFGNDGRISEYQVVGRDVTEQNRAADALRKSEDLYRTIFTNTGAATIIIEKDTTIVLANEGFARLSGYSVRELEGKQSWTDFVVPEDLERMKKYHHDRRNDPVSAPGVYDFRFIDRHGRVKYCIVHVAVIPGTTRSVASALDITDRVLAEQDYRNIVENIQDVYYRTDAAGNLIRVSPSGAAILGYDSVSDMYGKNIAETIYANPGERKQFLARLEKGGGVVTNYEVQLKKMDGTPVYALTSSHKYYDAAGNFAGVEGILRDITDRKRAEDELRAAHEKLTASEKELRGRYDELALSEQRVRESEQKYRELAELLPQIVFEVDRNFTITFVNRQAYAALGYSAEEAASGYDALSIIDPSQHDRIKENIRKMVDRETFEHTEYTFRRKDGSTFPGLIYADPVFREGELTGFRGIIVDITDRKRTEHALRESELFLKETQKIARLGGWKANPHTDYLEWTDGIYDIIESPHSYRPGLIEGMKYYTPEDIPVIREKVAACLETGEPFTSEARIITETGKTVWTELRGLAPVIEGTRSYVIGTLQDITERKIAGNALRESEKRFKTLFERSAEAQLLIGDTGKITDCNDALLTLFAVKDKKEILGHSPEDFAPEFQPDGIRSSSRGDEIFSRVMKEGMVQYEWAHQKHDTVRTPVMTEVICTLINIAGQPMIHASIRDITDRKIAQDSLREREATLASIFRAAPTGIGMVINRVIMKVNDRLCDMTGYQAEELLGKSARILYPSDEDYEYVGREKYEQIRKSGTGTVETRWQRRDGTILDVLLSSTPIDPADHSKGVTFTVLDITDRKRQERIQKAQLELGLVLQKIHRLTEALEACLASAIRVSDMDAGAIFLADPATGCFDLAVAQNLSSEFISSGAHYPAGSINAWIVMAGRPVYVPFGTSGIVHTPAQEQEGLRAAAFIPVTSGGRVVACLNVASRVLDEVPDSARPAVETIAIQIGSALERIRSEDALRLKDRAIASSINAIVIADMNGRITYVNDAFTRMWGYTATEASGMPVTRLGSSEEEVEKFVSRFRSQGTAIGESIANRKDGSPFDIQVSGSLVFDENGNPTAMLSSFIDITERKKTRG